MAKLIKGGKAQLSAIPFGVVAGDDQNYTVEITSVKVQKKHVHERRIKGPHYHDRYKNCCFKSTTTQAHKIKIMSRYSYSFVKGLGIRNPGNHRNHAVITRSDMYVRNVEDVRRVTAYVNVMEEQIIKDLEESTRTKKLVRRSAQEIFQLKHEKYPNMMMPIQLNCLRNDEDEDALEEEEPSSPVLNTPRMKKRYNI